MGEWDTRYLGSRDRATDTKTFSFERPSDLDYVPGQFFFVLLDQPQGPYTRPIEHHFSFSSSPTEPTVELTTRMTGHEFKQRLDALVVGEGVHIAGPDGAFVLAPGTPPGQYHLRVGVYRVGAPSSLSVLDTNGAPAGVSFDMTTAMVKRPGSFLWIHPQLTMPQPGDKSGAQLAPTTHV